VIVLLVYHVDEEEFRGGVHYLLFMSLRPRYILHFTNAYRYYFSQHICLQARL